MVKPGAAITPAMNTVLAAEFPLLFALRPRLLFRPAWAARLLAMILALLAALLFAAPAHASRLNLSAGVVTEVKEGMRLVFNGNPDAAIAMAKKVQGELPQHPVGYLLEVNALWWKMYCAACSVKYNLIDAWERKKLPEDAAYFDLADRAIRLAEAANKSGESAEMHVYAGFAYGLKARLHGLRGESLSVARTGVKGREHFLRALQLDPEMGDAYTGIGLYNYFADALSPFAKFLRFFLGIPGGSRKEGIQQLEKAMAKAELSGPEAQFYLARNLRNFDQKYERAAELLEPLAGQFPQNSLFPLHLGDVYGKLNRREKAEAAFRAAMAIPSRDSACAARVAEIARAALAALTPRFPKR
jgi:tetratricopeptide (TPR) repeat protein